MNTNASRLLVLVFSVISYAAFLATIAAAVLFLSGIRGLWNVDGGPGATAVVAVAVDLGLLGMFAVQHTVMARGRFKAWITRAIPASGERSVFVLAASCTLLLTFWQWRPLGPVVWNIAAPWSVVVWIVYAAGWATVIASTFMIDHFDLFGLRQAWVALRGASYTSPAFQARWLYSQVRHPIMSGFVIAVWATPHMTAGHLVFALASTGYIAVGVWFEEKDLIRAIPDYLGYRSTVGAFVPKLR